MDREIDIGRKIADASALLIDELILELERLRGLEARLRGEGDSVSAPREDKPLRDTPKMGKRGL
jgi:hypothetical protein